MIDSLCIEHPDDTNLIIRIIEYSAHQPAHLGASADSSYDEDYGVVDYEVLDRDRNKINREVSYNEEYLIIKAINDYMEC